MTTAEQGNAAAPLERGLQARARGDRQAALAQFLEAMRARPGAALPMLHLAQVILPP